MFDKLFQCPPTIARHFKASYSEHRQHYLSTCKQQGDPATTQTSRATALFRIARALGGYPDLQRVTTEQLQAAAGDWTCREQCRACRRLNSICPQLAGTRGVEPIPSAALRILSLGNGGTRIYTGERHWHIKSFLCWCRSLNRALTDVKANAIDAYHVGLSRCIVS